MEQAGLAFSSSGRETVEKHIDVPSLPVVDDVGKDFLIVEGCNFHRYVRIRNKISAATPMFSGSHCYM
jgi:hypothetical protein